MENIDFIVEYLFNRCFDKHYPPSSSLYNSPNWNFYVLSKNRDNYRDVIRQYLDQGFRIKTGWTGTSIRGYRDHVIFIQEPLGNKGFNWNIDKIKKYII